MDVSIRDLPDDVHAELARRAAASDISETYLALRETEESRSDPETLRALADARESVRAGDVVYGSEAVRALVNDHRPT